MGFMRIQRKQDERTAHACTHNLADIPNGVTVVVADLIPGVPLREGSAIGPDAAGLYHLVKTAKVAEAATATATAYKVEKGHHFKVGDFVMAAKGAKAYAISAIDTTPATHDTIAVGTTLGAAIAVGAVLTQAKEQSADTTSAFKYAPVAVCGDSYTVEALTNTPVVAVTFGQFKTALCPPVSDEIKAALPTVKFI